MKNKKLNFVLLGILLFIMILIIPKNVEAKSYSIENMDIQATINNNGSVTISQNLIYKFDGDYNGIYITIPTSSEEIDDSNLLKKGRIDDSIYEGKSVIVNEVSSTETTGKLVYQNIEENMARNGTTGYYTLSNDESKQIIKVYRKSQDSEVTFNINYTIEDLCVKHNDIGELFYNFIGGAWEVKIKNLNIDIYLPNNQDEIKIWGHGPYDGVSKIINKTHANFKVSNVKPGQYVAARIMFSNDNISQSTKLSNINAEQLILNDEKEIFENKEAKKAYTYKILIVAGCLLIYWIILMLLFEKDKKYVVTNIDEDELFKKYNPMIAGCIQGSRTILARDIIAVILNLIEKKIINLEFKNVLGEKDNYTYLISKNPEKESEMDSVEKFVYNWVFEKKSEDMINLNHRLEDMPKDKQANTKFKQLNRIVEQELNKNGANKASVPMVLRGFNVFLFILSLVLIYKHIMFNGFSIYSDKIANIGLGYMIKYIVICIPLVMGLLYIPLNLIIMMRHKITKTVQRFTGQRVATTTIALIVLFAAIIVITALITTKKYIIADEILICISTIIILTDNLMLKNSATMIEDFSKLNTLKDKIKNYSLMEDRDIEQVTLWGKYLSYAVSFGVADRILKRIKGLNLDEDLTRMMEDVQFINFVTSDYYIFYRYASLDRRFMKAYGRTTGEIFSAMASGSGSSSSRGGGRRIFRWRRIFWRWRKRRRPEELSKKEVKMGIRIIYGKPGSGKSQFCFSEIANLIEKEKKIFVITPEQFSFTAEKKLMDAVGKDAVLNAEVVTLSRMAYRVLNEIGGNTKTSLSKCGKAMLIYSILNKYKKNFGFLGKSDENIELGMRSITELKKHGITVENLKEEIEKTNDTYLKTKLEDMTLLYEQFEKKIENSYIEETDLLNVLATNLSNTDMVKESLIYIDEFAGFTKQEYEVIKELVRLAKEVSITITTDNLNPGITPDNDIYYSNKITLYKLIDLINDNNFKLEEPVFLEKQYRFKTEELKHLSENIYNIQSTKYEKNVENIQLFLAKNPYSEIENIAKQISKLVRNKKYRYKDISIITKNIDTYSSLVRAIFDRYEIPVFIDEKRDLNQNIIVQYILSILEILNKNFDSEEVFNYIKLGFCEIDKDEIFKLENYCTKWGIKQSKWKKDFIYELDDEGKKQEIERLNELRKQIIEPLIELKENIKREKTAINITKQLYKFIIGQKIEEKLSLKINRLEENGYIDLANEYKASYQIVIDIFDEIVLIFNDEKLTIDSYYKILKIGLKNSGLGKIPGTQDQVIFGDIDRSRSHKVKNVFIIGLNDGIFPSINKDEGFFNDVDRENLKQDGIELAKGTLEQLYEDNFNIYRAFTTSEASLYLSYTSTDSEGKSLRPSMLIHKIKKIFPRLQEKSDVIKKEYEVLNKNITYEELIENISKLRDEEKISEIWYEIYNYYKCQNDWQDRLTQDLEGLNYTNLPQDIKKENIDKLYGNKLSTSISRLEKYRSCPFSYYLQYGLGLKEKDELKVQSFNTGSFMHETIDEFFEYVKQEDILLTEIKEEQILKIVSNIIDKNLDLSKNYIFTATAKYKVLVRRLKRIVSKALKYIIETLVHSDFSIEGTEIEFGKKGKYPPIVLELENGKKVEIIGKIDRLDTAASEDGKYLRIIDYKSSSKNIDLNEVYAGLQIQLLTYSDAICKAEDIMPAGIFYFSLLEQMVKAEKKISDEEIEEIIRKNFKMKGLILADVKIIKMNDNTLTSGSSKIIPAAITKEGNIIERWTSGVDKEQFKVLQDYIDKTIKDISKEILSGKIDLKPYNKKGKTPCEYCRYRAICGFDTKQEGNSYNYIDKKSKDDIISLMKKTIDNIQS